MKMVSKLALAAALSMGVAASPALAQKKGDKPQEAPLQVSEAFRKPAANAEKAIKAKDWAAADRELTAAEAVAKTDDEKYYIATMRFPVEVQKQSRPGIIAATTVLLASPRTPEANKLIYNFYRGQATFQENKHADALPFLLAARDAGMKEPDLYVMLAQIYDEQGKRAEGVVEMGKAIDAVKAAGQKPADSWYRWATSRVAASGDRAATATWQMRYLRDYPNLANWRIVIINYRNSLGNSIGRVERINIYRLLRKSGALADTNDYFEYAQSAKLAGLPLEAMAVIDEGRNSGKVAKTDADFNRLYDSAKTGAGNDSSLDALARSAKTGADLSATADGYLGSGNYARALELYDQALTKSDVKANEVNLHRGVALMYLNRKDEAKTAFSAVTGAGALTEIAKYWLLLLELPPLA